MTPEEIQAMAKGLAQGQAVWYVLSAVIGGGITGLAAYFAEKGKNRATKEDIAEITREVEKVKDVFNRQLEDLKANHQLRMVAAERRLQAHQDAFQRWHKISALLGRSMYALALEASNELDQWYQSNCVFLASSSRMAIQDSIHIARQMVEAARSYDKEDISDAMQGWDAFVQIGDTLLKDVDLPGMSAQEVAAIPRPSVS